MRQEDAAARAGVSRETWVRYEGGSIQPGTDVWLAVAAMGADVQYIFTGRRDRRHGEGPLSSRFHRESSDGVEAVLQRMAKTIGADPQSFGYARILNVSERVLSGWRKRGEVAMGFVEGFAREYGTPIGWLLHGAEPQLAEQQAEPYQVNQNVKPYGLSADEAALLEAYRGIGPEARVTLQNLLKVIASSAPAEVHAPKSKLRQKRHAGEVEPVSLRSADPAGKNPSRQRGPGDDTQ